MQAKRGASGGRATGFHSGGELTISGAEFVGMQADFQFLVNDEYIYGPTQNREQKEETEG
jgi:hypothetical protein